MAAPLLLLAAAAVVVASSEPKGPAGPFVAIPGFVPGRAPGTKPARASWPTPPAGPPVAIVFEAKLTSYAGNGKPTSMSVDVPKGGEYVVVVQALTPAIGYRIKIRGKKYGRGLGPDGSAKVVEWVANAVTNAGKWAAPATSKDATAAAVAAGIKVLTKVVAIYANLIKRARLKAWTRFRNGDKGSKAERAGIKKANAKWFSADRREASDVGKSVGVWRFEASGPGEWPLVSEGPGSVAKPTVTAKSLAGGYMRITIESAELSYKGEMRYDATVAGLKTT